MQFSELWLRSFVSPALDSDRWGIAHHGGAGSGRTGRRRRRVFKVVVAQIVEAEKHPNADKLRVCKGRCRSGRTAADRCGAPNAAAGIRIPRAPGRRRSGRLRHQGRQAARRRVLRHAVLGQGARHSDESSGLLVLPEDAPVGTDMREYLKLDDTLFTIKLTPNRADCLSLSASPARWPP